MKLLLVTQKVDKADPILGFFHRWIEECARNFAHVTVITQHIGEYNLPANVTVESLGKEQGKNRISQIFRFRKLITQYQKEYDAVLVHMTPIWVVLGAHIWQKLQKPVYLWYEARGGGWTLPKAIKSVQKVFGATKYGLPVDTPKHVVLGHGIDTDVFTLPTAERDPQSIVAIGRMTKVKRYDHILRAFAALPSTAHLDIYGVMITDADRAAYAAFTQLREELHLEDRVPDPRPIEHDRIPTILQRASLLLHAAEGGLDKALLEAMACGCLVVSTSTASQGVLPQQCVATPDTMGKKANTLLQMSKEEQEHIRKELRTLVTSHHSLSHLIARISGEMR